MPNRRGIQRFQHRSSDLQFYKTAVFASYEKLPELALQAQRNQFHIDLLFPLPKGLEMHQKVRNLHYLLKRLFYQHPT
jgi:hypothetical protein